jgi:hypothetical protein
MMPRTESGGEKVISPETALGSESCVRQFSTSFDSIDRAVSCVAISRCNAILLRDLTRMQC